MAHPKQPSPRRTEVTRSWCPSDGRGLSLLRIPATHLPRLIEAITIWQAIKQLRTLPRPSMPAPDVQTSLPGSEVSTGDRLCWSRAPARAPVLQGWTMDLSRFLAQTEFH